MLNALPALLILIGFPHFGLKPRRPAFPADSLPPPWKTVSRLALEDQFVLGRLRPLRLRTMGLELHQDPRLLRVEVNPDSGTVTTSERVGEVPLGPGAARTMLQFSRETSRLTFERLWRDQSLKNINSKVETATPAAATTGLSFRLPSPLPSRVQSLLGPGGPALNVSGSENIRLSGQSNWSNQQTVLGAKRSLFPTLNMQQDLDIRLEGQLSDRIKVNLLQNSANQIPLANRIAINYKGDEDDLVQELDLGNTSLTLPGTQYVSYSGRNEGLFGVKTALRYGPLDFTVLASKQEGKSERASYTGGSSVQTPPPIADYDYLRDMYFFLYDPNEGASGNVLEIDRSSIALYRDNSDYSNTVNLVRGRALVDPRQTTAPPGTPGDTLSAVCGLFNQLEVGADRDYEVLDVYGPYFLVIHLKRQMSGEQRLAVTYRARIAGSRGDYNILVGTQGNQPEPDNGGLPGEPPAIRMKLLRAPRSYLLTDSLTSTHYETDLRRAPFNAVRELELKNFYQLPGQGIDPQSFQMSIEQGHLQPPVTSVQTSTAAVPYIEVLGLDSFDETTGFPVFGKHDGKIDGSILTLTNGNQLHTFIDFKNGLLFFPDPRPFAPRLGPDGKWFDKLVSASLSRRDSLTGTPITKNSTTIEPNGANQDIYDLYNPLRTDNSVYLIDVQFTASQAQGTIQLGRGNLLDGSEVVTVSGQQWVRDRDYTIDYDTGTLTLKRQLGPSDQLNVNYSYSPLFQQAGRTLVGSAFHLEGRGKSLGGAFMYESKGAQDLRPRIGEEPSRSLITDLNGYWAMHPNWLTRMVDRLPGIRTTAPSDLNVQAEVGMSFPNPNTKNEIYIDDMEGVRDAVSLSLGQEHWHASSVPWLEPAKLRRLTDVLDQLHNAELRWYSPTSYVLEKDLKPNLTDALGALNQHEVLCLSVPRRPQLADTLRYHHTYAEPDSVPLWAGVTYPLDAVGLDLTRSQFIELWVNDFRDLHSMDGNRNPVNDGKARVRGRHVKLHIDLGTVSEDQMRSPDEPPNGILDTEDKRGDNVLTQDEDTGIDGYKDPDCPPDSTPRILDLTTAGPGDPAGDDFAEPDKDEVTKIDNSTHRAPRSIYPVHWRRVNGTENNRLIVPTPDTEDLNLNRNLDVSDDYIEYTIDLGDDSPTAPYLYTDVFHDFPGAAVDNGWRRYRIPLSAPEAQRFGNPNLALVQHVRVWLDGVVEADGSGADTKDQDFHRPLLMLGGLDIVGSRWQEADLDSIATTPPTLTTMTLNSVNTVDNADIYTAPFDPGQTVSGNQEITRREQSLSLEFTDLKPGSRLEAYKNFSLDENYSRYGKLNWFAVGFDVRDTAGTPYRADADTGLFYYVRFASDEQGRNYYEYRAQLPRSVPRGTFMQRGDWTPVSLALTDLSNLKLRPDFPLADPIRYAYHPPGSTPGESLLVVGRPSFTRLRRISFGLLNLSGKRFGSGQLWFDELRATDVAKDVDHAQRVQVDGHVANLASYTMSWNGRGADFLTVGESMGSGSSTDQFAWTTQIEPTRFIEKTGITIPVSLGYSRSSSRPRFSAGDDIIRSAELQAASETRTEARSFSTSYGRAWSERSNPFLRYTLGGITAGYSWAESKGRNPSTVDSSVTRSATVNYQIAPRKLLTIPVPWSKLRVFPLPASAYWNYSVSTSRSLSFDRTGPLRDSLRLRNDVTGRAASISFGADTRPLDFLHHHIEGLRNLTLSPDAVRSDRLGFINFGRVVNWRQAWDARYVMQGGMFLRPTLSWNSTYNQDNGPGLSRDLSVRSISNGQSVGVTWELPFDRLDNLTTPRRQAPRPAGRPTPASSPLGTGVPGIGRSPDAGDVTRLPGPRDERQFSAGTGAPVDSVAGRRYMAPGGTGAPVDSVAGRRYMAPGGTGAPVDSVAGRRYMAPGGTGAPVDSVAGRRYMAPEGTGAAVDSVAGRRHMAPGGTGAPVDSEAGRRFTPPSTGATPAPAESVQAGPRRHLVVPWRSMLAALGTISTDFGVGQSSAYSRLTGTPTFSYLFGFSGKIDSTHTHPLFGNNSSTSSTWHANAHTRVKLLFGSSANTQFQYLSRQNILNGVSNREIDTRYPDIDVDYGHVASALRLDRLFNTPQLHSAYGRSTVTVFANNRADPTMKTATSEWRPLLGMTGSFKNGARAELRIEKRNTENEDLIIGHSVKFTRLTTISFSLNRSYSQGQKMNILGTQKVVSSSITMGITGQYEISSGETVTYADATRAHPLQTKYPSKDTRLTLNANGSYGFSNNATGNLSLGFMQDSDQQTGIIRRNLRLELRAQFTF